MDLESVLSLDSLRCVLWATCCSLFNIKSHMITLQLYMNNGTTNPGAIKMKIITFLHTYYLVFIHCQYQTIIHSLIFNNQDETFLSNVYILVKSVQSKSHIAKIR